MFRAIIIALACLCLPVAAQGQKPVLTFGTTHEPPFATPAQDGYLDLLLAESLERIGYGVKIFMMPAERSLLEADSGHLDGDVGRVDDMSEMYPSLVIVPEPVIERIGFTAFALDGPLPIADWADLAPYHAGTVRGWKIMENSIHHARSVTLVDDNRMLFTMLKKGRIDVALSAVSDSRKIAGELNIANIWMLDPPLVEKKLYLFVHKRHAPLVKDIAQAIRAVKADGTEARIRADVARRYPDF